MAVIRSIQGFDYRDFRFRSVYSNNEDITATATHDELTSYWEPFEAWGYHGSNFEFEVTTTGDEEFPTENYFFTAGTVKDYFAGVLSEPIFHEIEGLNANANDFSKVSSTFEVTDDVSLLISLLQGDDTFNGHMDDSSLEPEYCEDFVDGFAGNDTLNGGQGNDQLFGNIGDDTLRGGSEDDLLDGGTGNDTLAGGTGADVVGGGDGNDSLNGDDGADTLDGGTGDDRLGGGAGNDVIDGGAGLDTAFYRDKTAAVIVTLNGAADASVSVGGVVEDTLRNVENVTGGSGDDALTGDGAVNVLDGSAGNDTLNGGADNDTLIGGLGNDTHVVDSIGDKVVEANGAGSGIDTVRTSVSYSVASQFIETMVLTGSSSINAVGNDLANTITGNAGNNAIDGRGGADLMNGGAGNDIMIGGLGNDTYVVDAIGDKVIEANGTGTGTDTVRTSVSYSVVSQFVENMVLTGTGSVNAIANNLANTITGNAGNNAIDGRGGADLMQGGLGNDIYYVDNALDRIIESNGAGTDTVNSSVSKAFFDQFIEVIRLTGSANINTTGNSLANTIVGNGGNNGINGREAADTLTGGLGRDSFVFNTALGGGNIDRITDYNVADDTIQLDDAVFAEAVGSAAGGLGTLLAGQFRANATGLAQDADDRIIYETDTGRIYYDSNGNAAGGNWLFADLASGLAMTAADFLVI